MDVDGRVSPVTLVPCRAPRALLRVRPPAAVIRGAAPRFFFLRQQKRSRAVKDDAKPAVESQPGPQRRRPLRLRDRIRAISHRLRGGPCLVKLGDEKDARFAKTATGDSCQPALEAGGKNARRETPREFKKDYEKISRLFRNVSVPDYVFRICDGGTSVGCHRDAREYFDGLCRSKGLYDSPFHHEARRWASILDDLVFVDKIDIYSSKGIGHVVDKLYAIEVSLGPVTSAADLHLAIDAAEAFDFPVDDGFFSSVKEVLDEARKRRSRRMRLQRYQRTIGGRLVTFREPQGFTIKELFDFSGASGPPEPDLDVPKLYNVDDFSLSGFFPTRPQG